MKNKTPDLMEMMRQLIAIPSVSSVNPKFDQDNIDIVNLLATWFEDLGFSVEVVPVTGKPGKANLIASLGTGDTGLVLAGHTDTVPYDHHRWSYDPFSLTEKDGRLYGLGASDMKGFIAIAIDAASQFSHKKLEQPLTLLATADEESNMSGAKELVKQARPKARYAVIGEPTEMIPVRMHKGITMEAVKVIGKSGHSSDPEYGNSALEGMQLVLDELITWRSEIQHKYQNPGFKVPCPTLNLGYIQGGDNPNRICAECEVHFDLRPLPGMDLDLLRQEFQRRITDRLADTGLVTEFKSLFPGIAAMETPASSPIVSYCEEITGQSAIAVNFATEGPFLSELGMETIILGPGEISQAHRPDEYLGVNRIAPTRELLSKLIQRFCVEKS